MAGAQEIHYGLYMQHCILKRGHRLKILSRYANNNVCRSGGFCHIGI